MSKDETPRGRPSKLTPELLKVIVARIRSGNYPIVVCRSVGIGKRTYDRWRELGRKFPEGIYGDFLRGVSRAKAEFEVVAVGTIRAAGKDDPSLLFKMLACTSPDRWGGNVARIRELEQELESLKRQFEQAEDDRRNAAQL